MKNRKLAVVALLLIAVLTLGVGYATLTDVLSISGGAEVTAAGAEIGLDEKVYFSAATVTTGKTEGTNFIDTVSFSGDSATFSANSLNSSDDRVVYTLTVTNDSDHDIKLSMEALMIDQTQNNTNSNPEKFTITYDFDNTAVVSRQGGTAIVTVTVQLKNAEAVPTSGTIGANFLCELTATAQD